MPSYPNAGTNGAPIALESGTTVNVQDTDVTVPGLPINITFTGDVIEGDPGAVFSDEWAFTVGDDIEPPGPILGGTASFLPAFDTFRGGKEVVIFGSAVLVDESQDVDFRRQTNPYGWTTTETGTGTIRPLFTGTLLSSGGSAGGLARIDSGRAYGSAEANANVELVRPLVSTTTVDVFTFEFYISASNFARITLRRSSNFTTNDIVAQTTIGLGGQGQEVGGSVLFTNVTAFETKIVRHANYVFLFANDVLLASTDRFTMSDEGIYRFGVSNLAASTPVVTRLLSFNLRSHAVIHGRLVEDKTDFSTHRLVATVPAAELKDVGDRSMSVFGPWGSFTDPTGFRYEFPEQRTVGRSQDVLSTYADDKVKD